MNIIKRKGLEHKGLAGLGAVVILALAGCAGQPGAEGTGNATAENTTATVDNAMNSTAHAGANAVDHAVDASGNSATGTAVGDNDGKAVAVLHPTKGNNVRGTVTFTQEAGGVRIVANLTGLKPGQHGFHAHQNGDCSAPDATSAGGHFNPTDMPHSAPGDEKRHAGDFGNITADASGKATYNELDTMIALDGPNSIIGRGIIVHANADDLKTQPTGDAGGRQACGVVGVAG